MGCEPTALHCLSFSLFSPKEGKEASVAGAQTAQGRPQREEAEGQQRQATQEDDELVLEDQLVGGSCIIR